MFCECLPVKRFWNYVVKVLLKFLMVDIPFCPNLLLLANDSDIMLSLKQALTTTKKTILKS